MRATSTGCNGSATSPRDVGGYLKKDKAWWYGAYRSTAVAQRYPWLLDTAAELEAEVGTGKVTYLLSPRQKLVGYLQHEIFTQSSFFAANASQPLQTSDALPSLVFPVTVWKGEYNAAPRGAMYFEGRVGGYLSDAVATFKSTDPRIVISARTCSVAVRSHRSAASAARRSMAR